MSAARDSLFQLTPLEAVQGVLDLMRSTSRPIDEWEPDGIVPYTNGYSYWFLPVERWGGAGDDRCLMGTAALSAEEILARIEARRA